MISALPHPMPRLAFLFLGGAHQVLHTAPVAAELSADAGFEITCYYASEAERVILQRVLNLWPGQRCEVVPLSIPRLGIWLARFWRAARNAKISILLANRRRLAAFDAVVTAERTSTLLKRLSPSLHLIHLPHGAGDRARGFEARLKRFDLVIVSGRKDADRMVKERLVAQERCLVSGSVKLGAIARLQSQRTRVFDNPRPVVLYNPHFAADLSSWTREGRAILDWFAGQDDFNLIFAPHVRLFQNASPAARAELAARAVPDRILIDLGSEKSCDMTYTLAADIYLGDVSSQVYEFIAQPRPCVFFDANHITWSANPDYACWHFGEVVGSLPALVQALGRAQSRHGEFAARQSAALREAMGEEPASAPQRAAEQIRDFMLRATEAAVVTPRMAAPAAPTSLPSLEQNP